MTIAQGTLKGTEEEGMMQTSSVNVSAFDSETQERMVVYQALYGDRKYWVRPEKMFFEQIERNGKRFSRFQEIDWEE